MYRKSISILLVMLMVLGGMNGLLAGGNKAYAIIPSAWQNIGNAGPNEVEYGSLSLKVYNGTSYMAYADKGNGSKVTVMKYTGAGATGWEPVGSVGFSTGAVLYTSLFIDNSGTPYVAYADTTNGYKATVMKFTGSGGTGWELVGLAFSTDRADYISLFINSEGTPYVSFSEDSTTKATVMKYTGLGATRWEVVGAPKFSAGKAYYTSLYIDDNDVPYLAYVEGLPGPFGGTDIVDTVMKFNGTNWQAVGTPTASMKSNVPVSLSVHEDTPYLALRDAQLGDKATVMRYKSATGWEAVGNTGFSMGEVNNLSMDISSEGMIYVSYSEDASDETIVKKYVDGAAAWEQVGDAMEQSYYLSLDVDNEMPYLAFHNLENKPVVKQFTLQPPTLAVDWTNYHSGSEITITFEDSAWRNSITAVTDGGTLLSPGDYEVSSGKMIIKAGVLSAGVHSIRILSTNYGAARLSVYTGGGTGSESDPYQINTADDLNGLRFITEPNIFAKLSADINLSNYSTSSGWAPINGFNGHLDGNGYKISHLTINRPNENKLGLFGTANTTTVLTNIVLDDVFIHGQSDVGGLVGYNKGVIQGSHATASLEGSYRIGGLTGANEGTISDSFASGSVDASSEAGGLVGENQGMIKTSFSSANVSGDYTAGGLVASNSSNGVINNSYATGTAYGYYGIGGLTGFNNGTISNSYAIGSVQGYPNSSPNNLGGLTPYSGTEILDSFYNIETTGRTDTGKGTGVTTEAMKSQQTYLQWDFASIWGIDASRNNGYPYLRNVQLYVDYNGNGSTVGTPPTDNSSYYKGVTVNVYSQAVDLVKEGFIFAGWNTSPDGSGTSYAAGAPFTITGDTVLYAKWRENGPVVVPVSGITVSSVTYNVYTVYVNNTLQFNAIIAPSNATSTEITWKVSQGTGNASITSAGLLKGISAGTVTVTATSVENAAIQGSAVVTVVNREETSTPPSGGTPTPPPVTETKPDPKPDPKPETKPEVKFNDTVVKLAEVLANLNRKIEETKKTPNVKFRDTTSHWAESTVSIFVKLGVVNGYADGSFRPNASITRAEFATILAKVFNLATSESGNKLKDASGHWAESSINALTASGIISGYEDGTFKPDREITRAEIISMISKILTIKAASGAATTSAFTDIAGVWNKEQIEAAASASLISGVGNGLFSPNKPSTRAEALTILLHVLQANPELNTLLGSIR